MLQTYPDESGKLLFTDNRKTEKPFGYLFINLLLIDIRSSAPILLEQLNRPDYPAVSQRLASAFDIISIFVGFLIRSLDQESLFMPPDNLLKLRKGISETMSVTIEYLRDRWDASVAGTMGLHPDARPETVKTSTGSHYALTWDSLNHDAGEDPLILSAIRALALWLREDDNDLLRKEASGLTDMFTDLYQSSSPDGIDFRSPILIALDAQVTLDKGRQIFIDQGGWQAIGRDLINLLQSPYLAIDEIEATRGLDAIRVLLAVAEQESSGTREEWMDIITASAAWNYSNEEISSILMEFQVAVLQLCCTLLVQANPGMRKRYRHSISAIQGIAYQVSKNTRQEDSLKELMEDVMQTLGTLG